MIGICPDCGSSWDDLRRKGRLGCAGCWSAFRTELSAFLRERQGAGEHIPSDPADEARSLLRGRIDERLRDALSREDYSEAGRLRDLLKEDPG